MWVWKKSVAKAKEDAIRARFATILGIKKQNYRIESYDISNTAGDLPVASMTVFVDGRPSKKDYKKFKVKLALGGDDYGAMAEVIGREIARWI